MRHAVALSLSLLIACTWSRAARAVDSAYVKALMAHPPREYATAPLWVWNDMLTDRQVVDTLRDLAGQGVKQAFVHPRPGLMTPYLSVEWFRLWKVALAEAERLDMNLWIYDENSYPSGFAGGWVPEVMPESRGRGLVVREWKEGEEFPEGTFGVYRVEDGTARNIILSSSIQPKTGDLIAYVQRAVNSPWNGGRCYVDLLYPGVTEKFLEITLEAYKRQIGEHFGKRVPGSFTDEPELRPAGGLPWTDDLPKVFQERWGYSLLDHLPSLVREVGNWKRVRHNYYQVLNDLFVERWARPYGQWCEKNGLEFTGHYWEHEWPNALMVPDNMALYAWHQRPAIDCLMNQYSLEVHGQFGNIRAVKELASVANQLGKKRTLCEAYGAGGWDLRFEDMKRIGDFLYVLGVNTMDEHLSYITLRGARKRDHPQSFSYHEPWWQDYHVLADYWARLSAVMSQGEQINSVLVIEPTTTAWMYNREPNNHPRLKEIGDAFQNLINVFETVQVEYDIGSEDLIARHGSVEGKNFKVGRREYTTIVIAPLTEILNDTTLRLLDAYLANGGTVRATAELQAIRSSRDFTTRLSMRGPSAPALETVDALATDLAQGKGPAGRSFIRRTEGQGTLLHHRRSLADGELVFLVNTSLEHPVSGAVGAFASSVEEWDLHSGKVRPYDSAMLGSGIVSLITSFELPPCGSLLLFFPSRGEPTASPRLERTILRPAGEPHLRPLGPNVLTLDYVDITAGGETRTNQYFYAAQQFAFQKNGMERNPWDSAVQFKDELISRTFPADSGFEASYKFTIAEAVPKQLFIVIERPDLYTITCNGRPVSAADGQWWLDKAFGKVDLSDAVKLGENVVALKAAPFTMYHEVEPAYVLGEFQLRPAARGFIIAPAEPLKLGKWNEQGAPFYAEGVAYTERFEIDSPTGEYRVALGKWYGSVARVNVNGQDCGRIFHAPWECDVTSAIKPGENVVEVIVIGTLKNTLGPHHGNQPLGSAWPGMFHHGPPDGPPPGGQYATVGYGLFEPFVLKQVK